MPLCDIAFAAGFRSVRRFNDAFRATYGRPPSSFHKSIQTSEFWANSVPDRKQHRGCGAQSLIFRTTLAARLWKFSPIQGL
jgi:AraC-like DNA-binding protein